MDKKIQNILSTVEIIHALFDDPILWKFNKNYLDALCDHLNLENYESLLCHGFLDAPIDLTSRDSFAIGNITYYPLIRAD